MAPTRWMCPMILSAGLLAATLAAADAPPAPAADAGARGGDPEAEAQASLDTWIKQGAAACAAREAGCGPMAGLLEKAALGFQAAHRRDKAIIVRKILVDPRFHLEGTEQGKNAAFDLA